MQNPARQLRIIVERVNKSLLYLENVVDILRFCDYMLVGVRFQDHSKGWNEKTGVGAVVQFVLLCDDCHWMLA